MIVSVANLCILMIVDLDEHFHVVCMNAMVCAPDQSRIRAHGPLLSNTILVSLPWR
jgi:hypothetical protein